MTDKIKKQICSLYTRRDGEYQILGSGFLIDDRYVITTKNLINENEVSEIIYMKIDGDFVPLSNDWTYLKDNEIDIAISKLKRKKREKKTDDFTESDFQNALKKVSRRVSDKRGK